MGKLTDYTVIELAKLINCSRSSSGLEELPDFIAVHMANHYLTRHQLHEEVTLEEALSNRLSVTFSSDVLRKIPESINWSNKDIHDYLDNDYAVIWHDSLFTTFIHYGEF